MPPIATIDVKTFEETLNKYSETLIRFD